MGISFAFQQPVRFKGLTVKDLITLASGKQIGVPEACGYLSEVGLCAKDYIDREVDASLSGGELKRIEIAMIMARGTKLSVFDEPEAGIDLWSFSNLIQVFEHLHEQINGSIIIISHQERILDIADRIIVLADGRIQTQGTRDEVLPAAAGQRSRACAAPCRKKCGKEGAERWTRSRKACWSRWPGSTRCPSGAYNIRANGKADGPKHYRQHRHRLQGRTRTASTSSSSRAPSKPVGPHPGGA